MTNLSAIKLALRRVGLSQNSSTFVTNGREYLNMVVKEISQRATWEWLFKNSTITTVAEQKAYSLASDVLEPLSFRNSSQDYSMIMAGPEEIDRRDPDQSETGDPRIVVVSGINSSTGYWEVELFPTPSAADKTIKYRYYSFVPDVAESNDSDNLEKYIPLWVQPAVVSGIAEYYLQEKGALEDAELERRRKEETIGYALRRNGVGDRRYMLRGSTAFSGVSPYNFDVTEGSLS